MPRILTFLINYVVSFLNSISNRKANLIIKQRMRAAPIDYSSKVVVYTAIFGGKDRLKEVPKFPGVDYICFTDDQKLTSKTWKVIKVKGQFDEPRRCAKIYKILPHRFLQEYDFSLWVDGTQTPVIDVRFLIAKFLAKDDIAFFAHPLRGCIYEEMQACIRYNKDDAKVIRKQEEKYRTANYPQNHGLIEGTVILRRHNSPKVKEAMEQWWQELNEFGLRDQLSFNYIAYRNNLNYCTIPGHAYDNHFFKFEEHLNPDTSVLNVGWILNGTKETASSRIMGLNVHEYLISKNISSRIMYAPEQRIVSQLPLRLEEIDDIFNTNLNILVLVKLGRGGNLSYLLKKCRFKNIKVVYLVCDEPSKKMIKDSYAIIATSSYFRKVIPKKYHNKLYIAFDGYEDDGVRHKIHSAERKIKLCFVSNQVWNKTGGKRNAAKM